LRGGHLEAVWHFSGVKNLLPRVTYSFCTFALFAIFANFKLFKPFKLFELFAARLP
jgi:hypothetical protein